MVANEQYLTQSLLKEMFPEFENKIDLLYGQDPVFREIAGEYYECIQRQEMIIEKTGKKSDLYSDTIKELKEELLGYLSEKMK